MPGQSAANRGRPSDWRSMGAGRLGISERKASGGDDNVDELGVSAREGIAAGWKSSPHGKRRKHWGLAMVTQAEKRRVAQKHMDAISADSGPVYGVRLIDTLPLGNGPMLQAMPTRQDLIDARSMSERAVAGYEVLLSHYRELLVYKEAMDSMAAQMIHPKMTGLEMAKMQLGRT